MRRPRPRPHLHYFRTQGTSGGVLRAKKIRGHEWGRPPFEIKKSRLPPFSEPPAQRVAGVERQRDLGEAGFLKASEGERRERARRDLWKLGPHRGVSLGG